MTIEEFAILYFAAHKARSGYENFKTTRTYDLCELTHNALLEAFRAEKARGDRYRVALERLGSSEAFHLATTIDGPLAQELKMRMAFARAATAAQPAPAQETGTPGDPR